MDINCTETELFIFSKISHAAAILGIDCYVIGGFVRDKILGRETKDIDIVCIGDGIALAHKTAEQFDIVPQVNFFKNFGTAQIKIVFSKNENNEKLQSAESLNNELPALSGKNREGGLEIEFVGARKESYNYDSRKPAVEAGSLEDDQDRRDFTINALAISLNKSDYGTLIDPFGGIEDIQNKVIKTPLAPSETFSDDPLRMMRAIRFAAQLEFNIEAGTLEAISQNVHRVKIVSRERVAEELNKILLSKRPSVGFDLLYKTGLLQLIFPQMTALAGAEYIDGKGHKDNFYHTLQVVDNISQHTNDLWLRWAAVLHDIAKPVT